MLDQHRARRKPRARRVPATLALVLALMGLHLSVGAAWADELIVDDADAAGQLTGTWEASATTPGFYGGGYLFHAPGHGSASVRWPFPADGAPGRYQVFVRWTGGPNRASAAAYQIVDGADATVLGFGPSEAMQLVEEKTGSARVRAYYAGASYDIRVIQPARLGPTGVWVVESVRGVGPATS